MGEAALLEGLRDAPDAAGSAADFKKISRADTIYQLHRVIWQR